MTRRSANERIEILRNVFVSKKELKVHSKRMEAEANRDPALMSPQEEEEWELLERTRGSVRKKIDK
jgi:hypothetical protein